MAETLKFRELAKKLRITHSRLRELIELGLPFSRSGRGRVFEAGAVASFLVQNNLAARAKREGGMVATTRAEASAALGISTRTLHDWSRMDGFPDYDPGHPGRQDGRWPIEQIQAWRAAAGLGKPDADGLENTQSAAKTKVWNIRAARETLELHKQLGLILDKEETVLFFERVSAAAQITLSTLPDRVVEALGDEVPSDLVSRVHEIAAVAAQDACAEVAGLIDVGADEDEEE